MSTTSTPKKSPDLQKVADELSHLLADSYVLYTKTQNYHWNVTGQHFYSLHKLFDEQYNELAEAIDVIAERIRALKAPVSASLSNFNKLSSIKEETGSPSAEAMVKQLTKDHEAMVQHIMIMLKNAEKADDQGTMDLLIDRLRVHEKAAWMLRSSL